MGSPLSRECMRNKLSPMRLPIASLLSDTFYRERFAFIAIRNCESKKRIVRKKKLTDNKTITGLYLKKILFLVKN